MQIMHEEWNLKKNNNKVANLPSKFNKSRQYLVEHEGYTWKGVMLWNEIQ